MKTKLLLILFVIAATSFFLNIYKASKVPACINADEAAFGFNAYSILQTGRDEYGARDPLRLKSFGDYKMPAYVYLTIPFIKILGLNDTSTHAVNNILAIAFPIVVYLLASEIFEDKRVGILAAFFTAVSMGIHIVSRQAHEAYLASFLIIVSSIFLLKYLKRAQIKYALGLIISASLLLFAYQSGRIFVVFYAAFIFFYFLAKKILFKKNSLMFLIIFMSLMLCIFFIDIKIQPARVSNLLFYNSKGFSLKINELRGEGGSKILYNKLTVGLAAVLNQHLKYYSPQFLAMDGDSNPRFGFPGMAPVTYIEYLLLFIGVYFIFKNKEKFAPYLLLLLLVAPFGGSLAWTETSLTRTYLMLVPIYILAGYGGIKIYQSLQKRLQMKYVFAVIGALFVFEIYFLFFSWDFYLNHYPKRALVIRAWECGYKEMASYIQKNTNSVDKFYITRAIGQPYMHLLYELQYPPEKYQKQAQLSGPDEYGFGQVTRFDKFEFTTDIPSGQKKYVFIGTPDEVKNKGIDESTVEKINVEGQEMFWIFKSK